MTSRNSIPSDKSQRAASLAQSSFPALVVLYAALYGAYGLESPFLPAFFGDRGLSSSNIGVVLASGAAVRLVAGPALGFLADRLNAIKAVLAGTGAAAGGIGLLYLGGTGFWPLLLISMLHSVVTAPLSPLADALSLASSKHEQVFAYGWIRGVGSALFVAGTLAAGQLVAGFGIASIVLSSSILFMLMPLPLPWIRKVRSEGQPGLAKGGIALLLSIPSFRNVLIVAALVIGSHAMNDAFAVIRWRAAGISAQTISLLWSESVMSEVAVFFVFGGFFLSRIGPAGCAALAATAGIVRWGAMAETSSLPILASIQLLHGFTFALMHLVCVQVIGRVVPERLSATALAVYGTLAVGLASIVMTLASGSLYGSFGGAAFWLMSLLCLIALPCAAALRPRDGDGNLPDLVEGQ